MPYVFPVAVSQSNGDLITPYLWPLFGAEYPGCRILNCAVGGSMIASWQMGQPNYTAAVTAINVAINDGYTLGALISLIGESDSQAPATAAGFRTAFWAACRDLRADVGQPYLPVIYCELGEPPQPQDGPPFPAWSTIRTQQFGVADANHTAYVRVSTWGCGGYEQAAPWCHRTPAAQAVLAQRILNFTKTRVPA